MTAADVRGCASADGAAPPGVQRLSEAAPAPSPVSAGDGVTPDHPRIVIDCPPKRAGDGRECNVHVTGIDDPDDVAIILLLVVEKITSVSTDSYLHLVEECRRIAAREQAIEDATPDGAAVSSPAAAPRTPGRAARAVPVARPGTNPRETT